MSRHPSLEALRAQIDHLDEQLVRLLNRRAELAIRVGHAKARGRQVKAKYAPEREKRIFQRLASLNGGPMGPFTTNYKFEAKFDLATMAELKGRCQHPIAEGSGTGGFAGATGRLDFKDLIGDPTTYVYRGDIKIG